MIAVSAMFPAQSPWTPDERARLAFHKWRVLFGRLSDGEDAGQLLRERKLTHRYLPFLRTWTRQIEAAFEDERG